MKKYLLLFFISFLFISCQKELTGEEIINRSIAFHDPDSEWEVIQKRLLFDEYRPDGAIRKTSVLIDLPNSRYQVNRSANYSFEIKNKELIFSNGEIKPERTHVIKDYYLYLWGLPMKLSDANTPVKAWNKSTWDNNPSLEVEVAYEKDTWFFHFDPTTYELIGYLFYTDAERTKGEKILLKDIQKVSNIRIPKERSWYTLPEGKYLGKDILTGYDELK